MRKTTIGLSLLLVLAAAACGRTGPTFVPEVTVVERASLPSDPTDPVWGGVPTHEAPLLLQDLVEPRLMEVTTPSVRVQAVTDGSRVAFRLLWDDGSSDDLPGPGRFADACAVQLPARAEADLPAPQMGEPGKPVEITYWRASWQAMADGRSDDIHAIYPGTATPHYPFDADSLAQGSDAQKAMALRYAPARALGNRMAGPRDNPVEDLVAEGPGTLRSAAGAVSTGRGVRIASGWSVVLERPMPEGLGPGGRTQVAFAIWQGAASESGSRKMRSGWIPLSVEPRS